MNNRTLIFSSVMSELLESFSPFLDDFFKFFHARYSTNNQKNSNLLTNNDQENESIDTKFFEDLFKHIPRSIPLYKEMIKKLCTLASSDVDGTIHFLTKLIKEAINGKPTKKFTLLQMAKTFPDLNNKVNFLIFFYISNIFIADLICQIMVNYYAKTPAKSNSNFDSENKEISPNVVTFLTRTAYSIATAKHELPNTAISVLSQWSVILSLLSEYDFNSVTQIFSMFLNANDITYALVLIQYVRFDVHDAFGGVFFDSIFQQLKTHVRKKTITNAGLEAVSKMIVTIPFNEELFTKLYQLIRPLRKDKNLKYLWPGSVILSCALFLRLPSKRNRSKFLQKQVLGSCNDQKKLETSLKCFAMVIIGRNTDAYWENWEWGHNPRANKYTYLHLNSACEMTQDDPRSFTNIFMLNYFVKSEFYLYPKIVKRILLHLASLDFAYFTSYVVPQFIELEDDDPRFISLLKIVPKVNQPLFWSQAFKKPNNVTEQLNKFNKSLHKKVLSALKLCISKLNDSNANSSDIENEYGTGHGICFYEKDIGIDSLLSEADQKVSSILDEWKVSTYFSQNKIRLKISQFPKDKYSLIDSLFPTLKLILDENDFNNTTMMDIFIGCSYINDSIVANTSYDIAKNVIPNLSNYDSFIQMLIVAITTNEDYESVYTCISIIESTINSTLSFSNDLSLESLSTDSSTERDSTNEIGCKISKKLLIDIEVMAFLSLSSEHPAIRRLGLNILKSVNDILGGCGLYFYLNKNFDRIEKDAKEHILIQSRLCNYNYKLIDQHDINPWRSSSTMRISFSAAVLCSYYDAWIFFVSAMMNILIEVNYQPFFKHIKSIIHSFTPIIFDRRAIKKGDIGEIIIILSSMFYTKTIKNSERYKNSKAFNKKHKHNDKTQNQSNNSDDSSYYNQQYTPYSDGNDERQAVCTFITKLLSDEYDEHYTEIGFKIIPHLHFSILGSIIDVLSNVSQKKLPKATQMLSHILRLPEIDSYFINHNFRKITSFINTINTYLLENQLNTPRIMEWTKNQTISLMNNVLLVFDYCTIITSTFSVCKFVKEDNWPITTREVVFRFLVNWAIAAYNMSDNEINQMTLSSVNTEAPKSVEFSSIGIKEMKQWWRTITTKFNASVVLKNLREYAKNAIVALSKVGPMFTHSPLFDDIAVHFLGSIELSGMPILSSILHFHFDIIFDDYIKACYVQPTTISEAFFNAIVDNTNSEHGDSLINKSGKILMLAMIFGQHENTRAHELIDHFLTIAVEHDLIILPKDTKGSKDIINDIVTGIFKTISDITNFSFLLPKNNDSIDPIQRFDLVKNHVFNISYLVLIPQIFTYAAEAAFKEFFTIIDEYKTMSISFKDIINVARVWTSVIRFLPKQHTCVQVFVPPQFNYFTPYQFLTSLVNATEKIDEDRGKLLATLWEDFGKAPDHRQIIPIFLSNMVNSKSVQVIYQKLLDFFPDAVLPLIDERCSFAYFFHCTKCMHEDFTLSSSGWSASFLCHVFENNFDKILPKLPTILQFVIIFKERGLDAPFRFICRKFDVECPEGNLSNKQLRNVIEQLVNVLSSPSYKVFSIENWGNECLKWLFACDNTHLASVSFLIYNVINKPYDSKTFHYQVIHTVSYHIGKVAAIQEKKNQQNTRIKKNVNKHDEESSTNPSSSSIPSQYLVSLTNDLTLLIDESFIFFSKHLEGNDILIYNYISSFLDSQILPHLELIGAIGFFLKAFIQPEILILVCQNIITLVRPLIPMIEKDRNVQELIDKCVEKIDNEDVKMIVVPIKRANPNLFPHLAPYEQIIKNASINALCNALVHYAVLAESSSRSVLDCIFDISTTILNRVSDENNTNPLTRLYQHALRSITTCPSAFNFIQIVCQKQPQVATNEIIESFVWTRSLDDVNRSIKLVLAKMKCGSFNNLQISPSKQKLNNNETKQTLINETHSSPSQQHINLTNEFQKTLYSSTSKSNGNINDFDNYIEMSSDNNYSDTSSREKEKENDQFENSSRSLSGFSARLTDCHSYKSVLNFLYLTEEEDYEEERTELITTSSGSLVTSLKPSLSSTIPRILPFAAQKEMIEGMRKIKTRMEKNTTTKNSTKQSNNTPLISHISSSLADERDNSLIDIPNSTSIVFNSISQTQSSGRRRSKSIKNKKNDSDSDETESSNSDSKSENFEEEEENLPKPVCQPNFATIFGSLVQFPIGSGSENSKGSVINGLSPIRHPKKLMLALPQSSNQQANDDDDESNLVDRNILEDELERMRIAAIPNNLSPNEFFRDGFSRRRSSSNISTS